MHKITEYLVSIIDWVLPRRESDRILRLQNFDTLPWKEYREKIDSLTIYSLASFKDEAIRLAVHELKFHRNTYAAKMFARKITPLLEMLCSQYSETYIVPMPLHRQRERDRGYNQVMLVLTETRNYSEIIPARIRPELLVRTKSTKEQTSLGKHAREQNVRNAFTALPQVAQKHIVLIDDVYTTGATCRAAATALLRAGSLSVTCVVLSRA